MAGVRRRALVALVVLLALLGAACGNDDNGGSGSGNGSGTGTEAGAGAGADADADAEAALLAVADLPPGWQAGGDGEQNKEATPGDPSCIELDAADEVEPEAKAKAEFAAAETGPFVLHAVALFEDEDTASEAIDQLHEAIDKCKDFSESDENMGTFTGSVTKTSPAEIGDETVGATLSATGTGFAMTGDLLVVRKGRGVFMLTQFGVEIENFGGNKSQEGLVSQLATKALAKLEAAV